MDAPLNNNRDSKAQLHRGQVKRWGIGFLKEYDGVSEDESWVKRAVIPYNSQYVLNYGISDPCEWWIDNERIYVKSSRENIQRFVCQPPPTASSISSTTSIFYNYTVHDSTFCFTIFLAYSIVLRAGWTLSWCIRYPSTRISHPHQKCHVHNTTGRP